MDQLVVNAVTRTETGKRVAKKLRENGRLPAVMYNSKGEAVMLDIDEVEFTKVWKSATPTTLVNLKLDGKSDNLVFIKDTEYDIKTDRNLHADFHAIDEKKALKVTMKVLLSGNPAGVREGGFLTTHQSQITIQCLPKNLPIRVTADISGLGVGQVFRVKDLGLAKEITVLSDPEAALASVSAPRT
ncbi:50S ribosomal protein L25 [Treponema brennaborense]|uniref:Large ribosomal subunit protein bL25 n=1 Tax=Treponema brennaborense (strain DSM 12168 / CIP 105900 / DD5/3) TaxID=906968 RepID=F4LQI3_TREBD|nr:50S ribosomal protein L25 [Treponema brennaborense]AEE17192.1 50S ribosomal protein L25 [Treponema brennaborense DSM 12168]